MNRSLISAAALAALSLLASGCSKPAPTTTTTTTAAATPPAPASRTISVATGPVYAAGAAAFETGPGVTGDTSQTAALSAPANSNGTTPSTGVVPRPTR
jgi:hypothetical protein